MDFELLLKERDMSGQPTNYELEIQENDEIKLKLLEIESRERSKYEELMETVGPRPTEEELEEEAQAQAAAAAAAAANPNTLNSTQQASSAQSVDSKKGRKSNAKRELPEAVRNKMTNNAALVAAGGSVKSWMLPGATISAAAPRSYHPKEAKNISASRVTVRTGSRLRIQKRITIKDALFVMESRRELRNSELLYKWWANVK